MSAYNFSCWNCCGSDVSRDWDEVAEDTSGRMAYCCESCFQEDCTRASNGFNQNRSIKPPYKVGDEASEAQLLAMLKTLNPYIAHSVEEEEVERFSGNWHYIWVPDLEDLQDFAEEIATDGQTIAEVMADIDYSDWEEFLVFQHPVKGMALLEAWNHLHSRSISLYIAKGSLQMDIVVGNPPYTQE